MPGREVDVNQFCARLGAEDRHAVQQALASGQGVARYGYRTVSFGTRDAYLPGLPPMALDGTELGDFVAPVPSTAPKVSPLFAAVNNGLGPPQIRRPRVSPSVTEHPLVEFETRTSQHPRADGGGFIDASQRFASRREEEVRQPQRELSESEAWWRDKL